MLHLGAVVRGGKMNEDEYIDDDFDSADANYASGNAAGCMLLAVCVVACAILLYAFTQLAGA